MGQKRYNLSLRKLRKGFLVAIFVFVSMLIIKAFITEPFVIPGPSMEDTINPDDIVLIDKIFFRMGNIKPGDVLIFKLFTGGFIAKRCIGLPGQEISIQNGVVLINNIPFKNPDGVKMNYIIETGNPHSFYEFLRSERQNLKVEKLDEHRYRVLLNQKQLSVARSISGVTKLEKDLLCKDCQQSLLLKKLNWELNNLGPLTIPRKGMRIKLDPHNFIFYKDILTFYEKAGIISSAGQFYQNGEKINSYMFKNDYYFVMGDHREQSTDSRYFGLIPKQNITGRMSHFLYSKKTDQVLWRKMFSSVD